MDMARSPFRPAPLISLRAAHPAEFALAVAIDDDACRAYADAGLFLDVDDDGPFAAAEHARWADAAHEQRLIFACYPTGEAVGFSAVSYMDGHPHLDQVSVRRTAMRQGIGRMLVERALRWSVPQGQLWLTTYDHVPWNGPWYERLGFQRVPEAEHGPELRRTLEAERAALPAPEHRVAMRYIHR
jgi:GNAT superfamily N-acetyltransferase